MPECIDLKLFDGGASGTFAAPAPVPAPAAETAAAAAEGPGAETPAPEDKARAFRALIRGEYRDQYAAETQKLINRRFRETEALRRRLKALAEQGGGEPRDAEAEERDASDEAQDAPQPTPPEAPSAEADARPAQPEHGGPEDAAARERDARALAACQAARWAREAEALKAAEPDFDLDAMRADPAFALLLTHGIPLERCWRACTAEQRARAAAAAAEQRIYADIRARGARPAEAGGGPSAAAARPDVSRLSDAQVLDVLARLARKERISFG